MTQIHNHAITPCFSHLDVDMRDRRARAMLLAIGMTESHLKWRRQLRGGRARGLWQFEDIAVRELFRHPRTSQRTAELLRSLNLEYTSASSIHNRLRDDDVLAACFARLLLWTNKEPLPQANQVSVAWQQYRKVWRPGKPQRSVWRRNYLTAWHVVNAIPTLASRE